MIQTVPAVIVSKKRRRIIRAFRKAKALSAESAMSLDEIGLSKNLILEIQKLGGVIVKVGQDRYYLDENREAEITRFRRVFVLALVVVVSIIIWYFI